QVVMPDYHTTFRRVKGNHMHVVTYKLTFFAPGRHQRYRQADYLIIIYLALKFQRQSGSDGVPSDSSVKVSKATHISVVTFKPTTS
ncbi:hypothetical protein J6590_074312, partial [Homalodisca vitripennis]